MDPLSAIGLASSVVAFVDFGGKLVLVANELRQSPSGSSIQNLQLEAVVKRLSDIASCLQGKSDAAESFPILEDVSLSPQDVAAIKELSSICHADCKEMLDALQRMKVQGDGNRVWQSVKAAFHNIIGQKKLAEIGARIQRTQGVISLHISTMLGTFLVI